MKKTFGYVIVAVGVALALLTLVSLLRDFGFMISLGDPEVAEDGGFLRGGVFVMLIRTVVVLGVSVATVLFGMGWIKPEKYGRDVQDAAQLHDIYEQEELYEAPATAGVHTMYEDKSDAELADIYRSTNAAHYHENFASLLGTIKRRVEARSARVFE